LFSDYKRLDTSSYFIITNFHTEFKPQENLNYDMNSTTFTLYTQPWTSEGEGQKGALALLAF